MKPWKKKLPETTFFKIAFTFSIIMLAAIAYISFCQLSEVNKAQQKVIRSRERQLEIEKLFSIVKDAERFQRGYIISGNKQYYILYNKSRQHIEKSLLRLGKLKNGKTLTQHDIASLKEIINTRYVLMDEVIKLHPKLYTDPELQFIMNEGAVQMHKLEEEVNKKTHAENIILNNERTYYETKSRILPLTTGLLVIFSLFIFFISFYKIYKETLKNKKINEDLTIINQSFQYAEEISQIGHWKRCPNSDYIEWSSNLYKIFGLAPGSLRITEAILMEFVHPDDKEIVTQTLNKARIEHRPPKLTYRIITKDGNVKYLKTVGKLVNIDNTPLILGTTCDVTVQIEVYNSLDQKNKELIKAVEELASFNHIASHDLQEPLRKIQMFISRILTEEAKDFSTSGKEYFERISVSALRMEQLIDDLLLYSQTNKEDQVYLSTDLNEILLEAKQELQADIDNKKAIITNGALPVIHAIPFQMRQLFINLLSNSLKYSNANIPLHITITNTIVNTKQEPLLKSLKNSDYYKITFLDNGIGFKQEFAEKIFVLFQRLHKKESYTGTGIGLAICKKIIENHNGYIFAEGSPDNGASFHIYLPV